MLLQISNGHQNVIGQKSASFADVSVCKKILGINFVISQIKRKRRCHDANSTTSLHTFLAANSITGSLHRAAHNKGSKAVP